MPSLEARITELEVRRRPVDLETLSAFDRDWYRGLSAVSWLETVWQFAAVLAERRYWAEHGRGQPWSGDWRAALPAETREVLEGAELERLAQLMEAGEGDAVDAWARSADAEGWPALRGPVFTMDRAGFDQMLQRRRRDIDISRGCDMPGSVAWRRDHPGWHPGMTGEEADAFEAGLLDDAVALASDVPDARGGAERTRE